MTTTEDNIEILFNAHYGGFYPSNKSTEIYNRRMREINSEFIPIKTCIHVKRHDKLLVQIFRELGDEFATMKRNTIEIYSIPKKYENCYIIDKYEGIEYISVDINKYILKKISEILVSNNNHDDKINEINIIMSEKHDYE